MTLLAICDVGTQTELNRALLAIPGVHGTFVVGLPDDDPPTLKHLVGCHNGWEISIWQDRQTGTATADVAVSSPDGDDVRWGDATLLVNQPIDSVLSLVRMVAKEGNVT